MKLLTEFEIDGLPPTGNARGHWAKRYKETKKWKRLVHIQCLAHRLNGLRLENCQLILTRHSANITDFDNRAFSFKPVIDGLKEAEVIIDDNPNVIGEPDYRWEKVKRGQGKITVQIWVCDPEKYSVRKA